MKYFIFLAAVLQLINWEPDFENARQIAEKEHKLILLNFSGSDWCGPCIMMRRDYLDNEVFIKFAGNNLVLVNADFPRKKKNLGSPEMIKRNEVLAEKYNKNGNFPFTLLLDADGKIIHTWNGKPQVSVETWVEEIQTVCNSRK